MKTTQNSGRRPRGRGRRPQQAGGRASRVPATPPAKQSFWQKLVGFLSGNGAKTRQTERPARADRPSRDERPERSDRFERPERAARPERPERTERRERSERPGRSDRKPEAVEVTSPKLYVGNLSFDATESDLFELFKGVGSVRNAEIVSHKYTEKSKGFGFVTMQTVDEARRAVEELHDKDFMGRQLVVSGAKTSDVENPRRGGNREESQTEGDPEEAPVENQAGEEIEGQEEEPRREG